MANYDVYAVTDIYSAIGNKYPAGSLLGSVVAASKADARFAGRCAFVPVANVNVKYGSRDLNDRARVRVEATRG